MIVLLWDIDGTLINNDSAGLHSWGQALEEELGRPADLRAFSTAGLTDLRIARDVVGRLWPTRRDDVAFHRKLLRRYEQNLESWLERRDGAVLPNVVPVLEACAARSDVDLALLTGNIAAGGRKKLRYFGIDHYFGWGAFADEHERRDEIARSASLMARERHGDLPPGALWVIGDTEHDVACGQAIGARTIGLGTGPMSADELRRCGATLAFDTLPEPEEFLRRVRTPA